MEATSFSQVEEEKTLNLRDLLKKCGRNWYWFLAGLVVAFAVALAYIRYATPLYQTDAELLIKDDKGPTGNGGDMQNDVLGQLSLLAGNSNVQNEMAIIQSRTVVERAVRDLELQTAYFVEGRVRKQDIYMETPVLVTPLFLKDSVHGVQLQINVNSDGTYTVSDSYGQTKVKDGTVASLKSGSFLVKNNHKISRDTGYHRLLILISPINTVVRQFQNNLSLSQTDKTSSVIQLTLKTKVPKKGEDFLNTLIREYTLAGRADKNKMAANTINFVDGRLDSISGELSAVEGKLEHFLSTNSIANLDEQSKLFIDQVGQLDQQIVQQNMQTGVLKQIEEYVSQPEKEYSLVPSTLGIQDPTLLSLVQNYNALQLKRSEQIAAGASTDNPIVGVLDQQLTKLRNDIKENTANLLQGSERIAGQLKQQNQNFEDKIRNVPRIERDYIAIKRQQDIKQTLYLYLLQKREEAAITEAASVSNNRIIDPAKTNLEPISPKKRLIYLAALLLGLAIPGGLIYLTEILNRKITSRQDVEAHTSVPVYGEIGHSKEDGPLVVVSGARGVVPEQFRSLRTNLSFVLGAAAHNVILVTSSMGGEGKSFVSLNLAMTYALMGKRAVLLGLDLRKPKIGNYLDLQEHPGISSYLSSQIPIGELPIELKFGNKTLFFVNSGPVPPNPSEMLLQPEMETLMAYLKKNFEYIILDTPPVGLVADAQILGKYADASLYIVRHEYTLKDQVKLLEGYYKAKRLPKLGIVLNDIKAGDSYRYGYGGYGYGNGYYSENSGGTGENGKVTNSIYQQLKKDVKSL